MIRPILFFIMLCASLNAQDVLSLRTGEQRAGRLVGLDEKELRLEVLLPPPPGIPSRAQQLFATVVIPRADISQIEFAADPARDQMLKSATIARIAEIETLWTKAEPWLPLSRSPSARIGSVLAGLLLQSGDPAKASRALKLFSQIESGTWNDEDRVAARLGRLRAMVATGHTNEAVREAGELAANKENPIVCIEAKFLIASVAECGLRKFLEDNPRWMDDVLAIPRRNRLYNEALDLFLYPALFHGAERELSARGLWRAAQVYQLCNESSRALECARDVQAIYPGTAAAMPAKEFIASLPEHVRASDPEKDARDETPAKAQTPASSPQEKSPKKPTRKKSHDKTTQ